MSARTRLERTRALLMFGAVAAALLWALATAIAALALAGTLDWWVGLPRAAREIVLPLAALLGGLAAGVEWWRARAVRSLGDVALWIERERPDLRYALVTLVDRPPPAATAALESAVSRVEWQRPVLRLLAGGFGAPLGAGAVAVVVLLLLPPGALARVAAPAPGDLLDRAGPRASRLQPLIVSVEPPAYSGLPTITVEDPSGIRALTGSRLVIRGPGEGEGPGAALDDSSLTVRSAGGRWSLTLPMPARPGALRLEDGAERRLVVLEPVTDSLPVVTLLRPEADTVLHTPAGTIPLAAEARDDLGLTTIRFEYIVSSGSGESFTFRTGVLGRADRDGSRTASVRAALNLTALGLEAGDIVHLRAVAEDGNTVTGPGVGVSETRTLRVPRRGEYDSVAVDAAAPAAADSSLLSQRMLIQLTEALEARRPRLRHPVVVEESQAIGRDQRRLRRQVADMVFMRLEGTSGEHAHGEGGGDDVHFPGDGHDHGVLEPEILLQAAERASAAAVSGEPLDFHGDESPVVRVNRPLLEAYNAMWNAGRELEGGKPGPALPHMYAALEAIQRARAAERVYLRGRWPVVVLDLERIRLAGDRGGVDAAARGPRAGRPSDQTELARRYAHALVLLGQVDAGGVDSLLVLRIDALLTLPAFAAALGEAIEALSSGRNATRSLLHARRLVAGSPRAEGTLAPWGGSW